MERHLSCVPPHRSASPELLRLTSLSSTRLESRTSFDDAFRDDRHRAGFDPLHPGFPDEFLPTIRRDGQSRAWPGVDGDEGAGSTGQIALRRQGLEIDQIAQASSVVRQIIHTLRWIGRPKQLYTSLSMRGESSQRLCDLFTNPRRSISSHGVKESSSARGQIRHRRGGEVLQAMGNQ